MAALGAGCLTPSIPIPPPDAEEVGATIEGEEGATTVSLTYPPRDQYIDSIVYVYNRNKAVGIIQAANADGSVGPTMPVRADIGDQIVLSFERDDYTASTCFRLRDGNQSATAYCD